jgi:hypothetical protein
MTGSRALVNPLYVDGTVQRATRRARVSRKAGGGGELSRWRRIVLRKRAAPTISRPSSRVVRAV